MLRLSSSAIVTLYHFLGKWQPQSVDKFEISVLDRINRIFRIYKIIIKKILSILQILAILS